MPSFGRLGTAGRPRRFATLPGKMLPPGSAQAALRRFLQLPRNTRLQGAAADAETFGLPADAGLQGAATLACVNNG